MTTQVNVAPLVQGLMPYIIAAGIAVINGLAAWAVALLKKKTNINISDHALFVFDKAADAQAGKWIASQAPGWEKQTITVDNPFAAFAAKEVMSRVPEEAQSIGMTPEKLKDMIVGKIGALQAQALSTTPVVEIKPEEKKV